MVNELTDEEFVLSLKKQIKEINNLLDKAAKRNLQVYLDLDDTGIGTAHRLCGLEVRKIYK